MLRTEDILTTLRMFHDENLDVRTVTMGISLMDCAGPNIDFVCRKILEKIHDYAGRLVHVGRVAAKRYGIPIVNFRLAVSPVALFGAGHGSQGMVRIASALNRAAEEVNVDFVGGFSALVQKGCTQADNDLLDALPEALSATERLCGSFNVATTRAGINMEAILRLSASLKALSELTASRDGFGCAKVVVFANMPDDNPFMAGAVLGVGEPECVVNIGVSGPGVVKRAVETLRAMERRLTLGEIAEEIKCTAFRITRIGELIGNVVAEELGVRFGIVDLSLAPTPRVGDSVGEVLQMLGIERVGAAGSTAALALLTDAVKKGGAFASSSVGGLSGAFIPVSEDAVLANAVAAGDLTVEKLEAMTSVCSVGLDMVAIPGDTSAETLAGVLADEVAIGVMNNKTTACRIIPVPGKRAGDRAVFGGLFGESPILPVRSGGERFVRFGGQIPAPIHSLRN
jgi:hypothetical protein